MKKRGKRRTKARRQRQRAPQRRARSRVKYPMGTIAHYGPDDRTVTKIAVGVVESEEAEPIMERWVGPGVATDPEVQAQIVGFLEAHGVKQVAMTDGVLGCPHEEGIDFPEGQECPYCPFWRGKQGIRVADETQDADPHRELKAATRLRQRLLWEMAQLGAPLSDEDARLVEAMHEHPEYSHLWERLDELPDKEIERDGVNPILHVTVHQIIENQLADGNPQEVRRVLKALMQQGLTRHEAIHRIANVVADEIYHVLRDGRPFDEPGYVRKLRQLVR